MAWIRDILNGLSREVARVKLVELIGERMLVDKNLIPEILRSIGLNPTEFQLFDIEDHFKRSCNCSEFKNHNFNRKLNKCDLHGTPIRLRILVKKILNKAIQEGSHDSIVDARYTQK